MSASKPSLTVVLSNHTAAQVAHARVKADILNGTLRDGQRLRIADLATTYQCGSIPLREALNRLTGEGLVLYTQQRGFAVAPLSFEYFQDLTRARVLLSEVAMREAVQLGDAAWEELVIVAHHRLRKVPRYLSLDPPVPNPDYDRRHREFHSALLSGSRSMRLVQIADELFDHAERYRALSRTLIVAPREDEHGAIVRAALSRNVDVAVQLIKAHIELTCEIVAEHRDSPHQTAEATLHES